MGLSRTSQAVALTRVGFARPHSVAGGPDALPGLFIGAQVSLLDRAGWLVTASADAADLGTGAEPGRSLLVKAELAG